MNKPLGVWKRTYYLGGWFTLVEVSVLDSKGNGGSFIFDSIEFDRKQKKVSNDFWKEIKKSANCFEDCEKIFVKLIGYHSDLWKSEFYETVEGVVSKHGF